MKKVHIKSAMPIYVAAAIWLLAGLIVPKAILHLPGLIITALVSLGGGIVSRKFFPGRDIEVQEKILSGNADIDKAIEAGRARLENLVKANEAIPDETITENLNRMVASGEQIFQELGRNTGKYNLVRRFMNYYLPTAERLMEQYQILSASGSKGDNVMKGMESVRSSTGMIADAFEKCLDNIFADRELNIDADIKVMQTMLAGDGLLKGEPNDIHSVMPAESEQTKAQPLTLGR